MANRRDRIHRIAVVQEQLHRLAEWRLADLQRQEDELADRQRALIEALNDDQRLQGLFVDSAAKRLTAVSAESTKVAQAKDRQADRVFAEARRLKQAQRMAGVAAAAVRRDDEQRTLETVVEASVSGSIGDLWFSRRRDGERG